MAGIPGQRHIAVRRGDLIAYEDEVCGVGTCTRPPGHDGQHSQFDEPLPDDCVLHRVRCAMNETTAERMAKTKEQWIRERDAALVEVDRLTAEATRLAEERETLRRQLKDAQGIRDLLDAHLLQRNETLRQLKEASTQRDAAVARLREVAVSLRDLSPGPHPGPMNAEDYIPLIAHQRDALLAALERATSRLRLEHAPFAPVEIADLIRDCDHALAQAKGGG